jgi:WD40 repeat protein
VYNFYTGECPSEFTFRGHKDAVKAITWLEDDTGFVSTGKDNMLLFWRLHPGSSDGIY